MEVSALGAQVKPTSPDPTLPMQSSGKRGGAGGMNLRCLDPVQGLGPRGYPKP